MLMNILKKLTEGGIYSNRLIAIELGVDDSLVEQMIDNLLQLGYIEKQKMSSYNDGCGCCSNKGCCGSNTYSIDLDIWRITEKGKRAISN